MHAVIVRVTINDVEPSTQLHDEVAPMVSNAPGFVAGYRAQSEDRSNGMGMVFCESEDAARAISDKVGSGPPGDQVTLEGVEVREVVASA